MALPMSVANQLIADLLFNEEPLFGGGCGSYIEKQKERVKAGEIQIEDVREDTERGLETVQSVTVSTLLGGCTKAGRCDSLYLVTTACVSCDGAIIIPEKLKAALQDATDELCNYPEDSGEHQIVKGDIELLAAFKARLIDKVEV